MTQEEIIAQAVAAAIAAVTPTNAAPIEVRTTSAESLNTSAKSGM
jgi:hypothetical protein